ncbi:hypothetical protein [Actinoplanes sp. NPDC051851]|uniref:hypothetical protein n=1 Tax=Actinoplanes sp. NPDC051851 TaxID=3154753 RepID=UPI00343810E9
MTQGLRIGADAEKMIVAVCPVKTYPLRSYPVKARTGRLRRQRTGTVTELLPVPPTGRGRDARVTTAARLALPLLFLCAFLGAAGLSWWLPASLSVLLIVAVWRRQARAAAPAVLAVPRDTASRVLWTEPERAAFGRALAASHRVRRTWPALAGMIDPVEADRSLTRSLDELATVLARRQELRRLRGSLDAVRGADIPADSPARIAADLQRERADELWHETGAAANRIIAAIDAAARAGEGFARELRVAATARHAERTLARVAGVPAVESGPELADRTAIVISAYRDLAA